MEQYAAYLTALIRAAGQELMDRAEDLAGSGDLISKFQILIDFPQDGMPPTLEVTREHVIKRACAVMTNKE